VTQVQPSSLGLDESGAEQRLTLSSFLTDGSIARLCDELARLTGVPIWLRDGDGRVIVPGEAPGGSGARLWHTVDSWSGAERAHQLVSRARAERTDLFVAPLKLRAASGPITIGEIVAPADWGKDEPGRRRALERALTLLAGAAAELCEDQLALRDRVRELDALFRLSSLVVRAGDSTRILEAALDLAIEVLGADAGSVAELDEHAADADVSLGLRHRVSRGLSERWITDAQPLSVDGRLRARALQGEVVTVSDLQSDERIADHDRAREERLASLMTTGLVFQGRPLGLIRLYSRSVREFTAQEQGLLRSVADHAAMALAHTRLRNLREEDQRIKRQVRTAADVQRRMMPQTLPRVAPFDLAARYAPSFHLGGDFYDSFVRRGQLVLAVCDVVGKGVPAALLMSAVRASLRAFSQDVPDLDEVMSRCNKALARDTLESEFATLWAGVVDPVSLRLTYCGAGHDPPLIFRVPAHRAPGMADVDELTAGGMALGIDPSQRYQLGRFDLQARDVLLAYTDGLSDATNFENRKFGKDRIKQTVLDLLAQEPNASAARIAEALVVGLRNFCGLRAANDDVTLVVLRVVGEQVEAQVESAGI
jgi:sigma-B regulation protein RsbU (phosphoserine phosphatase)